MSFRSLSKSMGWTGMNETVETVFSITGLKPGANESFTRLSSESRRRLFEAAIVRWGLRSQSRRIFPFVCRIERQNRSAKADGPTM